MEDTLLTARPDCHVNNLVRANKILNSHEYRMF